MSDKPQIQVKFLGSKDLIAAINQKLTSGPDEFVIERVGPEKDVTNATSMISCLSAFVSHTVTNYETAAGWAFSRMQKQEKYPLKDLDPWFRKNFKKLGKMT